MSYSASFTFVRQMSGLSCVLATSYIEDYIQSVNVNSDSVVQIDRDGAGAQYSWQDLVEVEGTNDLDILSLYNTDLLQVA